MTPGFSVTDWQLFLFGIAGITVLFFAWQGWQHGLGRFALVLLALPISFLAGNTFGFLIENLYQSFVPYPRPFVELLSKVIFGLFIYLIIVASAVFLFKATKKQKNLKSKLISGIGGVFFGVLNGVVAAIFLVILIRTWGTFSMPIPPQPGSVEARRQAEVYLPENQGQQKISESILISLMSPPIERWVLRLDPIPESYYKFVLHLRVISERQDIRSRFLEHQEFEDALYKPEIASKLENSAIYNLMESGEFREILTHPDFRNLYESAGSAEVLESVDWLRITKQAIAGTDLENHPII